MKAPWDKRVWADIPGPMLPEASQLIEMIAEQDDGSGVLALGVGKGQLVALAATLFSGPVVGIETMVSGVNGLPRGADLQLTIDEIQKNVRSLSGRESIDLLVSDISLIKPFDLTKFAASGFSFISVEAGRDPDPLLKNLKLASSVLKPGGVIMIDGAYNALAPGAKEAMRRFLLLEKQLKPFARGFNKTLLTDHGSYEHWRKHAAININADGGHGIGRGHGFKEANNGARTRLTSRTSPTSPVHGAIAGWSLQGNQSRPSKTTMYGMKFVRLDTRYGEMFVPDADTVIGRSLKMYGEWAEHEISVLSGLIKNGDVIVDVGANIGTHALAFAKRFPASRVVAIEPQPAPFAALCASALINDLGNLHAFNIAASNVDEVKYMHIDYASVDWNLGAVNLLQENAADHASKPLLLTTIDRLMPHENVRLLKIDVEGMEGEVIRGGLNLISRCRPYIYLEVLNMEALEVSRRQLLELNYELRWLETSAFNSENYRGEKENIWWLGEVGVLAMPFADDPRVAHLPLVTGEEPEPPRKAYALHAESSSVGS